LLKSKERAIEFQHLRIGPPSRSDRKTVDPEFNAVYAALSDMEKRKQPKCGLASSYLPAGQVGMGTMVELIERHTHHLALIRVRWMPSHIGLKCSAQLQGPIAGGEITAATKMYNLIRDTPHLVNEDMPYLRNRHKVRKQLPMLQVFLPASVMRTPFAHFVNLAANTMIKRIDWMRCTMPQKLRRRSSRSENRCILHNLKIETLYTKLLSR